MIEGRLRIQPRGYADRFPQNGASHRGAALVPQFDSSDHAFGCVTRRMRIRIMLVFGEDGRRIQSVCPGATGIQYIPSSSKRSMWHPMALGL
jgi:hypothetical protein